VFQLFSVNANVFISIVERCQQSMIQQLVLESVCDVKNFQVEMFYTALLLALDEKLAEVLGLLMILLVTVFGTPI